MNNHNLTMERLRESMKLLDKIVSPPPKGPLTICGMEIILNPLLDDLPRMQLSPKARAVVTPEFAAEMDAWMREFFGTGDQVITTQGRMFVGTKAYYKMKRVMG